MLFAVLFTASCGTNGSDTPKESEGQPDVTIPDTSADESVRFGVPEELDYQNKKFKVLGCSNWNVNEFSTDDDKDSDIVAKSLAQRDAYIESYLGVDLEIVRIGTGAQWDDRHNFIKAVESNASEAIGAYDMIGSYSTVASVLATRGYAVDLQTTEYFDDTKAWWPVYMNDVCTVNGKTYHASGDASINLLYYLQGVLFDAKNMEENKISEQEVYDLVRAGDWTIEAMFNYSKNVSQNNDSTWDDSDFYAIGMESAVMLDSFYFSSGLSTIYESDSVIKVSDDILSAKTLDIYDKVYTAIYTDHMMKIPVTGNIVNLLKEGRCIFNLSTIYQMKTTLADTEDIGVLPFPKYDKDDTASNLGYRTLVSNPHTQYTIPSNCADSDMSSAVLETMGYSSYTIVTPTVFENVMKLRYSKDTNASQMFDILRAGATTEMGILWTDSFTRYPQSMFRNAMEKGETNWVSNYKNNYENDMRNAVVDLNTFYMQ